MNTKIIQYLIYTLVFLQLGALVYADPIPVRLLDDFDHHGKSMLLFEKGGVFNYKQKGDYREPWLESFYDNDRGQVGKIVFPKANLSKGMRYGGWRLNKDQRYSHLSFWIKSISGNQTVNTHFESAVYNYENFAYDIDITEKWQHVLIPLADLYFIKDGKTVNFTTEHLHHFRFVGENQYQSFLIDDLIFLGESNLVDKPLFITRPLDQRWYFDAEKDVVPTYAIHSADSQMVTLVARVKAVHKSLPGIEKRINVNLQNGTLEKQINLSKQPSGFYQVDIILEKDNKIQDKVTDYIIVGDVTPAGSFHNPFAIEFEAPTITEQQLYSVSLSGINTLRLQRAGFTWQYVEQERGAFEFAAPDYLIGLSQKFDLKWMPVLQHAPGWLHRPAPFDTDGFMYGWIQKNSGVEHADMGAWENYVTTLVNRYKNDITHWEIWNKPDWNYTKSTTHPRHSNAFFNGSSAQYYEHLEAAYASAKKADPHCQIISGGISMHDDFCDERFTANLVQHYSSAYDIFGYHGYEPWDKTRQVIDLISDKPAWQTEVGQYMLSETPKDFIINTSRYLQKALDFIASGTKKYSWFIMSSFKSEILTLLHPNGAPKELLACICTLSRILNGAEHLEKTNQAGINVFTFDNYQGTCHAMIGTGRISIRSKSSFKTIDMFGFETLYQGNKMITVDLNGLVYVSGRESIEFSIDAGENQIR